MLDQNGRLHLDQDKLQVDEDSGKTGQSGSSSRPPPSIAGEKQRGGKCQPFHRCLHRFTLQPFRLGAICRAADNQSVHVRTACVREHVRVSYPGNPALRKQEKASDLHLATASHVSIWMAIDLAWICSIMDGERQLRLVIRVE